MKKGFFKRLVSGITSLALAFSMVVSTAPAASAWTANQWIAILSGAITYDSNLGGEMFSHELGYTKAAEYTYSERKPVFCIHHHSQMLAGQVYVKTYDTANSSLRNSILSENTRQRIAEICYFGFVGHGYTHICAYSLGGCSCNAESRSWFLATQALIWELTDGLRDPKTFQLKGARNYNTMTYNGGRVKTCYNDIVSKVQSFVKTSKANDKTYKMDWNASKNRYEVIVPVSELRNSERESMVTSSGNRSLLSDNTSSSTAVNDLNWTYSPSNNTVTFYTTTEFTGTKGFTYSRKLAKGFSYEEYHNSTNKYGQEVATGNGGDPQNNTTHFEIGEQPPEYINIRVKKEIKDISGKYYEGNDLDSAINNARFLVSNMSTVAYVRVKPVTQNGKQLIGIYEYVAANGYSSSGDADKDKDNDLTSPKGGCRIRAATTQLKYTISGGAEINISKGQFVIMGLPKEYRYTLRELGGNYVETDVSKYAIPEDALQTGKGIPINYGSSGTLATDGHQTISIGDNYTVTLVDTERYGNFWFIKYLNGAGVNERVNGIKFNVFNKSGKTITWNGKNYANDELITTLTTKNARDWGTVLSSSAADENYAGYAQMRKLPFGAYQVQEVATELKGVQVQYNFTFRIDTRGFITYTKDSIKGKWEVLEGDNIPESARWNSYDDVSVTGTIPNWFAKDEKQKYRYDNYPQGVDLTIIKEDEEGTPLEDNSASFEIYANEPITIMGKTIDAKDKLVASVATDKDGKAYVKTGLYTGFEYRIKETKAPKGYKGLEKEITFTVNTDRSSFRIPQVPLTKEIPNVPYGGVEITKNDTTGKGLKDAKFSVFKTEADAKALKNAVSTATTDKDGKATITGLLPTQNTYWLVETAPPSGFLAGGTVKVNGGTATKFTAKQPIKLTFVNNKENSKTTYAKISKAVFTNTEQEAQITVNKVGTDGVISIPLANAEFKITAAEDIYSQNGERIYTKGTQVKSGIKTDSNGKLVISSDQTDGAGTAKAELYCGTYTVTETKAPNGYRLPSNPSQDVTITADGAPTAQFKNKSITVTNYTGVAIRVYKADKQTGKLIAGARYGLYAAQDVKSLDGKTILWKKNALIATSTTTDTNGIAKFYRNNSTEEISILFGYKYFVKEITPPRNYKIDKEWQWDIDLTNYSSTSANLPILIENNGKNGNAKPNINEPQNVSINVYKYDTETKKPLAGAQFKLCAGKDVYKADGTILYAKNATISTVTTDSNGKGSFSEKVPVNNTYYVEETKAPINYVYLNKNHFISDYFTPEYKGDEQHFTADYVFDTIEVGNTYQKGTITVIKKDAETKTPLAGAEFTLYAMDDVTIPALNKSYKAGDKITAKTTGKDGKVVFGLTSDKKDGVLPVNHKYKVVETKPPTGYTSKGETQEFELKYAVNIQFVQVDDEDTPYYNDYQAGNVVVKKVYNDGTKKPLAGAQFTLYAGEDVLNAAGKIYTLKIKNADGTTKSIELKKDIVIAVSNTTGSNGLAKFTDGKGNEIKVPVGFKFYVKETKTPAGFKADPNTKTEFTLKYDASVDYVKMDAKPLEKENKPIEVYVSKKTLTGKNPLAGATLAVINTTTNEVFAEWKSTGTEKLLSQIPAGNYILRETITPDGYVVTTDIKFKVTADGKVTNASCLNSDLYEVSVKDNIPLIVMFDELTKVKISKVEIGTDKELKGATLVIKDKTTGEIVKDANGKELKWVSNGEAKVIEGVFIVGHTYILTETAAPAGYIIANSVEFTIKDRDTTTGKYVVQPVKMEDDYTHVEISKTDITTGKEIKGAKLYILDSKGNKIAEWTTDGTPYKLYRLAKGHYTLYEELAPNEQGYVRAEKVEFDVDDKSSVVQKVEMKDNYTKLAILKTDKETGKPLAGAVLQLLKADGTVYKEWTTTDKEYRIDYIPIGTYTLHEKTAPAGYVKFKDQTIVINEQDFIDEQAKDLNYIKRVTVADGITTVDIDKTSITDGKKVIGAHLVIKDSKGKVFAEWDTTEQSHTIKRMPIGEYTLTETFAPNGYVIANTIKFAVKETGEIQKVHMIDDITKLEINKYRANAKTNEDKPLAGAVLKLTDKETGKIVDQWTTDGTTHKIYEKLTAGKTYVLEELSAPAGYVVCKDKKEITISTNGKVDTLSLTNDTTKVDILKSTITGDEELEGAHLQVIDTTTNKVVEEWVSEKESHYIEAKLVAGRKYILRETISPNGFTIANDITFVVSTEGKVDKIVMKDEVTKLAISKVSAVTGKELAGATMQVIDKETGLTVDEWVTGEETDGKTSAGDMTHRLYRKLVVNRTYILREKIAPENYVLADDIEFTVNADGTVTTETEGVLSKDDTMDKITMTDYQQTGDVVVLKQTEGNKNIANIGFILSGKSNLGVDIYERVLTDENGKATFSNIPVGTYFINEDEDTVPYAYLVAEPQQVEVFYRQTSVNTFNNQERTGTIKIQKKTEGMLNIKGITLILKGISDSGREIEMTSETDENGEALFENLPIGTYAVTEVGETVPEGYLVADELTVTCVYAQTTTKELFNEEKSGSIEIHKTTEGMLNIKDIKFHLTGVSDAGRAINLEAITDEKGIAKFDKVPVGTYMITEDGKTTPIAYMVADKKECKVSYSETTTVEIKNEEKTGSIKVQKKTEGMKDISGIKFHLTGTSDSGRAINLEAITDKNGVADFGQVPIGTYVISEDGATVPTAYLVADNQECKAIYAQETTVTFVNEKKPTEEQPPQTGYNHPIGILLPTMLISLAGIAVFSRKRKEEE